MHCLSSLYWVTTPLHVLRPFVANHQEVECIYVANVTPFTSKLSVSGPTDRCLRSKTSIICHTYTFYLLMMGYKWAETCKGVVTRYIEHRVGLFIH
jgi:hypothetical protein